MPLFPFESASSTGRTKQAESWPRGRPAFISVGRVRHELPLGHQLVEGLGQRLDRAIGGAVSPVRLRDGRATRQKRSTAVSTGLPASSRIR